MYVDGAARTYYMRYYWRQRRHTYGTRTARKNKTKGHGPLLGDGVAEVRLLCFMAGWERKIGKKEDGTRNSVPEFLLFEAAGPMGNVGPQDRAFD